MKKHIFTPPLAAALACAFFLGHPLSLLRAQAAANPATPQVASDPADPTGILAAMDRLKAAGNLTDTRALKKTIAKVVTANSVQHAIQAPAGAKVIAVYKHPGDLVLKGEKIATLLVDGKNVPVFSPQTGVMQAINVSRGGILGGSSRNTGSPTPVAKKIGPTTSILITFQSSSEV